MNFSVDALIKNLPDNDFNKGINPYEYMNSFKKFSEDKLLDRCEFYSSLKDECISKKDFLHDIMSWIP